MLFIAVYSKDCIYAEALLTLPRMECTSPPHTNQGETYAYTIVFLGFKYSMEPTKDHTITSESCSSIPCLSRARFPSQQADQLHAVPANAMTSKASQAVASSPGSSQQW